MQTIISQNDRLKDEIKVLQRKIKTFKEHDKLIKPNKPKKKNFFKTLMKKTPLAVFESSTGENRPEKVLDAIEEFHEAVLTGEDLEVAETWLKDKKHTLFVKKNDPSNPYDLTDRWGETALMKAVKEENLEVVKALKDNGVSLDTHDKGGQNALMFAAKYGLASYCQILAQSANLNAKTDDGGYTALHLAAMNGHDDCVEVLLDKGASAEDKDLNGKTPVELALNKETKAVFAARKQEDADLGIDETGPEETKPAEADPFDLTKKERRFSDDPELVPYLDEQKQLKKTKKKLELMYDDMKKKKLPKNNLKLLREMDQDQKKKVLGIDGRGDANVETLHNAVLEGDKPGATEDVEKLLTTKRNKKFIVDKDAGDEFGETALMKASRLGYVQMVALLLLYKASVDLRDIQGQTAIMKAAQFGKLECVQQLLQEGAELDASTKDHKMDALMLAAERGHGEICKLLIAEGCDFTKRDSRGRTALDIATNEDCRKAIEEAMEENPRNRNIQI